jgi:hypothetical protein
VETPELIAAMRLDPALAEAAARSDAPNRSAPVPSVTLGDPASVPAQRRAKLSNPWRPALGASLEARRTVTDSYVFGPRLHAGLAQETNSRWAPLLEISVAHFDDRAPSDEGDLSVAWWLGRALGCALSLHADGGRLRVCGWVETGAFSAQALASPSVRSKTSRMTWLAIGLALRPEVELSRHWRLRPEASVAAQLTPAELFIEHPVEQRGVARVPWLGGALAFGAEAVF